MPTVGQLRLLVESGQAETVQYPDWYRPSKCRERANQCVLQGRHPFGFALGPEAETCRTCKHRYKTWSRSCRGWNKCHQIQATAGPATDVVLKWRACERWEARDEEA